MAFVMKRIRLLSICFLIGVVPFFFSGCSQPRDIDRAVTRAYKQCMKNNDYTIDFSTLMPFEWDTMCYYSGAYDLKYILEDLNVELNAITYGDVGPKVYFLNHGHIVYQKGWFPYPEPQKNTIYFDTPEKKFRLDKANAKFVVTKKGGRHALTHTDSY